MRARLDATGLGSVAHGVVVDGRVEWSGTAPASEIVLKPVDGRASRGVTFHRSAGELQTWLDNRPGEAEGYLAEERKHRQGIQCRISDRAFGRLMARSDGQDHHRRSRIGTPSPGTAGVRRADRIVDAAIACVEALGVDRGLLHTEVILDDAGAAHIVETHLRGGGDMILDLVRSSTGLDLVELFVRDLIEGLDDIPVSTDLGYASSQFVFPVEFGVITGWDGVEEARSMPGVDVVTTLLNAGDPVSPHVNSSYGRSVGALAHADDPLEACERARLAALTPTPVLESA